VAGEGPRDVVCLSDWMLPLEARWQEQSTARPMERLASFSRLISLDKRGIGCSDPVPLELRPAPPSGARCIRRSAGSTSAPSFP